MDKSGIEKRADPNTVRVLMNMEISIIKKAINSADIIAGSH
jgi:hypothetical protein